MITEYKTVTPASIEVGERVRKNVGDLSPLKQSMTERGQLQPVVVTPDNKLIAGYRRLKAAEELGWEKIDVVVVDNADDAVSALLAEVQENTCRAELTISEKVGVGLRIEEIESVGASQRHDEQAKQNFGTTDGVKFTPSERGKTRDRVGEAIGMSGPTYDKAKMVVTAAQSEPERYGNLVKEMDASGKVDGAHRKLRGLQALKKSSLQGKRARAKPSSPRRKKARSNPKKKDPADSQDARTNPNAGPGDVVPEDADKDGTPQPPAAQASDMPAVVDAWVRGIVNEYNTKSPEQRATAMQMLRSVGASVNKGADALATKATQSDFCPSLFSD